MALEKAKTQIPFATGVQQKVDPRWLELGTQSSAINLRWVKKNATQKRLGYTALSNSVGVTGGFAMAAFTGGLCSIGTDNTGGPWLFQYSQGLGTFTKQSRVSEALAKRTEVAAPATNSGQTDTAQNGSLALFAFQTIPAAGGTTGAVYATVMDMISGQIVVPVQQLQATNAANPKCVFFGTGGKACVIWWDSVSGSLQGSVWDPASAVLSFGAAAPLDAGGTKTAIFDVSPIAGDTSGYNAFGLIAQRTSGGNPDNVMLQVYSSSPFTSIPTGFVPTLSKLAEQQISGPGTIATSAIASNFTEQTMWFAYSLGTLGTGFLWGNCSVSVNGSNFWTVAGASSTQSSSIGASQTLTYITIARDSILGTLIVMGSKLANGGLTIWNTVWCTATLSSLGSFRTQWWWFPASKPFFQGQRAYCSLLYGSALSVLALSSSLVLCDMNLDAGSQEPARPVATSSQRVWIASNSIPTNTLISRPSAVTPVGNKLATAVSMCGLVLTGAGLAQRPTLVNVTWDFAHVGRFLTLPVGNSLFVGGGLPGYYDGSKIVEAGYLQVPDQSGTVGTITGGGPGLTDGQTYSTVWLYEWLDAGGQVHRSKSSNVIQSTTGGGNDRIAWTVNSPTLTRRQAIATVGDQSIAIVPYRSQFVNSSMSSTLFRNLVRTDVVPSALQNVMTNQVVNFTDQNTDGITGTPAPNTGGVLEPQSAPSMLAIALHQNRIIGIDETGQQVWFTNEFVQGEVPFFNDNFVFPVVGYGSFTAIASMDDKIVLFSPTSIVYFTGTGPNKLNQNSDFSDVFKLQTDIGCTEPRSVVAVPDGLLYKSVRGIYLLRRSLEVAYVGSPVEDTLTQFPVITSAVLVGSQSEVRFTCQNTAGTSGVTIRYNYAFEAWSVDQITDFDTQAQAAPVGGVVAGGTYFWLSPSGRAYQERLPTDSNAYFDGTTWITSSIESAWVKPAGLSGWARGYWVHAQGEKLDAADVTLSLAFDYSTSYTQTYTWTAQTQVDFATPLPKYAMRIAQPKFESMRVKLSDAPPTGVASTNGQGINWIGLMVEYGVYPGSYRVPPIQVR